jgi:hypothetical protein
MTASRVGQRESPEPATRIPPRGETSTPRDYVLALAAVLATFGALAVLFLAPYVTERFRYPMGWDAPTIVGRAQLVAAYGIDRFGAIRAGVPLLQTVLHGVTGQDAFTLVVVSPAVILGIAALGGAALACSAVRMRIWWLPVVGVLVWVAFGENGMLNLHLDNLLNASLVLPGFAAALGFAVWRRGALAAAILFAAAGLAHWPFWVFAMAIFGAALVATFVWARRTDPADPAGTLRGIAPLAGSIALSGALVASTFLWVSPSGWTGARLRQLRHQLRTRFFDSLRDTTRFYALPTAALGAWGTARSRPAPPRHRGWRFFLCLMGAWVLVTLVGGIAQALGFPTAGAREIHYFFPATILTAVAVWWVARWLGARWRPVLGPVAAAVVVVLAVGGFGALFVHQRSNDRPWFKQPIMAQAAASGAYVEGVPGDRPVVYVLDVRVTAFRPAFQQIKAAIGPTLALRAYPYWGRPEDYLAGVASRPNGKPQRLPTQALPNGTADPLVLVLSGYNGAAFRQLAAEHPESVVSDGVAVLRGPLPAQRLAEQPLPVADTRRRTLIWVSAAIVGFLLLAGSGWAVALLPPDPLLRVALAPALGAAVVTLTAFLWDRVGLGLGGRSGPIGAAVLATVVGWVVAGALRLRGARSDRDAGAVSGAGDARSAGPGG